MKNRILLAVSVLLGALGFGASVEAHEGCITSTSNSRGVSVWCIAGVPHQAHTGCRHSGTTFISYYRHGVRYTTEQWSDAYCDLGDYKTSWWFTYT